MSGKVVHPVVIEHECTPGWRWKPITAGSGIPPIVPGAKGGEFGVPPSAHEFPKGTVWECACGRAWVSLGRTPSSLDAGWRRERWWERRRRLRRTR
jgi:hypothetical protein